MKKILMLVLTAFLAMSFIGCKKEAGTIKIGVGAALSGDLASYGIPTQRAAELVVEEINANGGVLGRQVELFVEDDECDPGKATNTAAKLVGDGVVAVIGHICSGATKSALGVYVDENIVTISPSATNPPLTKSGDYPNFLRTIAPDDAQAEVAVNYAIDTLGMKTFAILHDRGDYGKGFADFCQAELDARSGVETVLYEGIQAGALDYSAIVNKVANSGADAVIYGGYHPEASKLVQQMKTKGLDIVFISDDGVKDDTFIRVAGEYAEDVYATGPMDTTSNPMAVKATEDHRAKYGEEPGAFFLNAYAATVSLLNAIEKAGSTDYDAIMAALQSEYVETPLGKISFDEKGDAIGVGFAVYQVQSGSYVELK